MHLYAKIFIRVSLVIPPLLVAHIQRVTAAEPIRIGIVQSSFGDFAPAEAGLTNMLRMLIEEQNAKGGLLGRPIEAIQADPRSEISAYAESASRMTSDNKISVLFGGAYQATCDMMGAVAEKTQTPLFCAGENVSDNINSWTVQLGLPADQRILPLVEFLSKNNKPKSWVLVSTDSAYGKEVNSLVESYLKSKGVPGQNVIPQYEKFGSNNWEHVATAAAKLKADNMEPAVVSTVLGESVKAFYEDFGRAGPSANDTPIVSLGFDDASYLGRRVPLPGSLAFRSYFESLDTPENRDFIRRWRAFSENTNQPVTEMMATEALGFSLWVAAVEQAGTPDASAWVEHLSKVSVRSFAGPEVRIDKRNHLTQPVLVGRAQSDGTYVIEAKTPPIAGDALALKDISGKNLVSDWKATVKSCVEFDVAMGCKPSIDQDKRTVDLMLATTRKVVQAPNAVPLFASDRAALTFGAARVSVPAGHSFGQVDRRSWFQWATLKSISDTEFQIQEEKVLTREQFVSAIGDAKPADALIYVHGFRNTFEDSVFRLAQIVWDTKYEGVPVVFSWPSRGTTAGYETDYDSAEFSAPAFRELLRTLKQDAHVATVHIIAHSMGSRVVLQALLRSSPPLGSKPIGELIFAAPDVDRQIFTQDIESVRDMARGITLYANKNDWALFASKQLRSQFKRAGDASTPDGPLVMAGVDTIDISSIGKDFFSLNHSTFAESMSAMEEVASLLSGGVRPPDKRTHILVGMPQGKAPTYWKFP